MVSRVSRPFLIAGAVFLASLCIPAVAAATVTVTSYKITSDLPAFPAVPNGGPSSAQAGAVVNAGSYSTFAYSSSSEDIKTALTNFAPGLLGNPESVPKCPEANLRANTCPAATVIGTSRLDTVLAADGVTPTGSFPGTVYNAEPLTDEPGRLGVVTVTPLGNLVSSIPFRITPRGGGDYGLTGTLTDIDRLSAIPALLVPNRQVSGLSFVLNGATNNYVRNPTSCQTHDNTGQAAGYVDEVFTDGPSYQFGTTGCDTVPFRPTTTLELGDRGTTGFNGYPPFVLRITQPVNDADQKGNKITLPVELNTNNTAYTLCSQAQADADSCPAESKFGAVTAKSPFLAEELKGPVFLVQQSENSLPGLLLDLRGRVHVHIQTQTKLVNNKAIQSLVLNSPQLPVTDFKVALNGGRKTGVFQNRESLCFKGNSTSRFNDVSGLLKSYGHNGTTTPETKLKAKVNGCGPGVSGAISGATGSRPSVRVKAEKHPDAPNFKELTVTLSTNLSLVKSRFGSGGSTSAGDLEYVGKRSFKVTGLPAAGEDELTIRLRRGAVQVSERSQDLLERGRSRTFRAKVRQTPVSGQATSTKGSFRARGR